MTRKNYGYLALDRGEGTRGSNAIPVSRNGLGADRNRRKEKPKLLPAMEYTPHTFAHAVRVAAKKAAVVHWHPNQLRHLYASEVRKGHGLEAAQVLLGHSRADVTQIYAERNEELAGSIAARIG